MPFINNSNQMTLEEKKEVIENLTKLTKNENIVLLKLDKGKGVVLMNKIDYVNKCNELLSTAQFKQLDNDPTRPTERKMQSLLRKIKTHLPEEELYKKLYPTGSAPGKLYGTAKVHKLKTGEGIDKLPLRPIVSNIGTATYQTAKYLAKLLSPLNKSIYSVNSTNAFLHDLESISIADDEEMVSFDVVGLFTNVPLKHTIDIILNRIYEKNEIKTNIPREDMKLLLEMCTKNVHFTFNQKIYTQIDGVAMGSPLGPVIAGIYMVDLETKRVPELTESIKMYYLSIVFGTIDTTVYRKETNTDLYINWHSFAPETWKKGTLKNLIKRAFTICNQPYFLNSELQHIELVFTTINGYPVGLIKRIIKEVRNDHENQQPPQPMTDTTETNKENLPVTSKVKIYLPYAGKQGELITNELKKTVINL
ncbi:uncharacterized protein [Clytia hemisphaerica]|uniref:uncharacterized protein n=1 Tax=Clytia hemisphaerica TaxID=252671 RepID=UPI0034D6FD42